MLLSVVTPTYNSAATLLACIESVAAQTHREIEHWVIDGGSKDGTLAILEAAARRYPHFHYISEKDAGIYDAMNKGLQRVRGDYVYFLGSDDTFSTPDVVTQVFATLGSTRPSVIYGSVRSVGGLIKGGTRGEIYDGPFSFETLLQRNICHQAIFYSREVIEKVGLYNVRYRFIGDWDYNLRCYAAAPFTYVDVVIANYNAQGSSSSGEDLAFYGSFFDDLKRYFGVSLFDRRLRPHYGWMGFVGLVRLRERKLHGLGYLLAACWHSPKYVIRLLKAVTSREGRLTAAVVPAR
jgi:glycosyltransferase involved in cell wall biosynthesis